MKKKSDADKGILQAIKRLGLALGKTAKGNHSGNAKEQRTKHFLDILRAQGTEITAISPHTSQKTAIVERRFGVLFGNVRAALNASGLPQKFCHWQPSMQSINLTGPPSKDSMENGRRQTKE